MSDQNRIDQLTTILLETFPEVSIGDIKVVKSPYRVCPLGAHIDHQYGIVTGMTVDRSVLLVYTPNPEPEAKLVSLNFPGQVQFTFDQIPAKQDQDWGNYARGAVRALQRSNTLHHGIYGVIEGNLPIGGLSSSAAVGVSYLLALEDVNDLYVTPIENIEYDRCIENDYIGLNNGILDQSSILLSDYNRLFRLDCQDSSFDLIDHHVSMPDFKILVVYSGVSKFLGKTGYNSRVAECHLAALELFRLARNEEPGDQLRLRHLHPDEFAQFGHLLSETSQKRSRHFFEELSRVQQGLQAWRMGDLYTFGRLINASGHSSIHNYECGSPHLITIYELLQNLPGVYGGRFSGAGFRGCCIALINPAHADAISAFLQKQYPARHPDIKDQFQIHICQMDHGARIL